ncbi:MAG: DNA repair protein RecO [Alphaproteobacteria bacterium]|nr:DNA repair protein RecO [Alphaproteobacteria bacterium]
MQFRDEGYIINLRKYGEKSVILTIVSKNHGLLKGFVRSALSKKNLGIYQLGNKIAIDSYARLESNMPSLKIELIKHNAVNFMQNSQKLAALSGLCSLCLSCLPENENLERFYYYIDSFISLIDQPNWLTHYAFFEFYLLEHLGIGLDLSCCADSGSKENLEYISPKSGKAVCAQSGAPYKDKLFLYPHFIVDKNYTPHSSEVAELLRMTEFFLNKNFFQIHSLKFPENRANLLQNLGL